MKKVLLSILSVFCSLGMWAAANTTLISGISLPSLPTTTYDGSAVKWDDTHYLVKLDADGNGFMQASAGTYGKTSAVRTWANGYDGSTDGTWSTTGANWDACSPFPASTAYTVDSNDTYVNFARACNLRTNRTVCFRFTSCVGVSACVKSNKKTDAGAAIMAVYEIGTDNSLTSVSTVSSIKGAVDVITVKGLDKTKTYVAYVYGANTSNGALYAMEFVAKFSTKAASTFDLTSDANLILSKNATSQIGTEKNAGTVTYKSSNEDVLTVSASGLIKAVGSGFASITVTDPGSDATDGSAKTVNVGVPYELDTTAETFKFSNATYGFATADNNSWYFKNGLVITTEGQGYQYASLTCDGKDNNGMKISAGKKYTINIPEGVTVYSAKVTARNNYASGNSAANWGTFFGEDLSSSVLPYSGDDAETKTFDFGSTGKTNTTLEFSVGGNQCQLYIELDATAPAKTYAITVKSSDATMGSASVSAASVEEGSSVKATATANTGYDFVNWTVAGTEVSTSASYEFTPTAATDLVANFEAHQYSVKFIADGIQYAHVNVLYGESINPNLQAPDKTGYTFKGWDPEIPAAIVEDMTFNAVYEVNKYNLTFIVDGQETTSQVAYGSAITAPTPSKEGYTFTGWSPALAEGATMPASDVTYTAQFSKDIVASDFALAETTADVEINGTTTVKYTTSSTGEVSVSSSSEKATVSVDESTKTITISGVKAGEATITVSQAADNNYSASEEKTITVTVNAPTDVARTTTAGKFGTICLPYKFKADGAKIYSVELNNAENALTLNEATTIEAGKAYLYQSTGTSQTFSYDNGDNVSEPVSSLPLVGVFKDTTAPTGSYVLQTQDGVQQFYIVKSSDITVPANKAYVKTSTTSSSAKSISIHFAGEDATGINALNALVSNNAKIYDINGRQLKSLKNGVNIVNGTKVVVK